MNSSQDVGILFPSTKELGLSSTWHFSGDVGAHAKKEFKQEPHACCCTKLREIKAVVILQECSFALIKKQKQKSKKQKTEH